MIKNIITALIASAVALPSLAASQADINRLTALIEETGTTVAHEKCLEGINGYYHFDSEKKIDKLAICTTGTDMQDVHSYWETLAHEATHVMQACVGGPMMKSTWHPRLVRELKSDAPHYWKILDSSYSSDDRLLEIEAFWMELQTPSDVLTAFTMSCFEE